jgi:hypothetical protein
MVFLFIWIPQFSAAIAVGRHRATPVRRKSCSVVVNPRLDSAHHEKISAGLPAETAPAPCWRPTAH